MLLIVIAVLPAFALVIYAGIEQRRYAAEDAKREALRTVRLAARNQVSLIETTQQLLVTLAHVPEVRSHNAAPCSDLFKELLKRHPYYANLAAASKNGDVFCSAVPLRGPVSAADRPWFAAAVETRSSAFGSFHIGRITGKPVLVLAYPILTREERVTGVVLATLNMEWLGGLVAQAQLPEGSTITAIDGNGVVLARHPGPKEWVGRPAAEAPLVKAILAHRREGTIEAAGLDGVQRLYSFSPLLNGAGEQNAYIFVGIPSEIAFAKADHALKRNLGLLGLIAFLTVIVGWIGSDLFIMRRITPLIRAAQRLSTGDLSARTGIAHEKGEMGELARSLDHMAEALEMQVTEHKRTEEEKAKLEEQFLQSQKMETVGLLAGGIAHDFNNILTAITACGYILQMRLHEESDLKSYVDQILASSERAANLVQSLLAFSRKQEINPRLVDINATIRKVEQLLSRIIGEDIELRTLLPEGGPTVMADSGQIEQVLMNLATNARDAMPGGGTLTIETSLVEAGAPPGGSPSYMRPGTYVLIAVSDTGAGMDEGTRQRIFEPFFTTKEVGKGTGLGLATAYGIVKQHGGYINVYSEPHKGTTFRIYLPFAAMRCGEVPSAETSAPCGGNETILVAEDDDIVRGLIRDILTGAGYTVLDAVDGEDAVNLFSENKERIGLVLLDVIMPKRNGKEAYESIRKERPLTKVLFMSGYTADIIDRTGLAEKGSAFISKPVISATLLRKIREMLDA
ncbi:MAG: ATP-binding protein [Nitrospirota bacterium]